MPIPTATATPTKRHTKSADHTMHGYVGDKDTRLARLRRVEGQVRGVARVIEEDTYYIDVLTHASATTKALEEVALAQLDDHLTHCVAEATEQCGQVAEEKLREASAAIARLVAVHVPRRPRWPLRRHLLCTFSRSVEPDSCPPGIRPSRPATHSVAESTTFTDRRRRPMKIRPYRDWDSEGHRRLDSHPLLPAEPHRRHGSTI